MRRAFLDKLVFCFVWMSIVARVVAADYDFVRDVQPILEARCIGCHGPKQQHGGLRLDAREFALQGGDSGQKVIETPIEANELWRRVASNEAEVRMPLEGPRLKTEELAKIEAWAKAGAHWPNGDEDETKVRPGAVERQSSFWVQVDQHLLAWGPFYTRYRPALWSGLAGLIVVAILARFRKSSLLCGSLLLPGIGLLALGMLASAAWVQYQLYEEREAKLTKTIDDLRAELNETHAMFRPTLELVRPMQLPDVRRTYYRGNDERSPKLFNGGFYRTATLDLALRDASGKTLAAGDACAAGRLELVFDIRRAHGAAPILFKREIGEKIFLSTQNMGEQITDRATQMHRLEIIEDREHWRVVAPLGEVAVSGEKTLAGRLYLIHGDYPETDEVVGPAHYGIDYKLLFRDGVLQPGSDMWMAALLYAPNTIVTPPEHLHMSEWFDFRPIPEIEGENTQDEKLIGTEPYQEKEK